MPNWWELGTPAVQGQSCQVGTAELKTRNVTSEIVSANALTRSLVIDTLIQTTCTFGSTALGSTEYALFRAVTPITVTRMSFVPQALWASPGKNINIYVSNSCQLLASANPNSSEIAAGAWTSLGTIANASIAACGEIRFAIAVSSCSGIAPISWQIDYQSTG